MRTSSMLTRRISGGRGVCGAHKLIPMSPHISCAPALPTPQSSSLKPQASSCSESAVAGRPEHLPYRTINRLERLIRAFAQMHTNPCCTTTRSE